MTMSCLLAHSSVPHRPAEANFARAELAARVGLEGFALSDGEILELWRTFRMYPVALSASLDAEAASLLAGWLRKSGRCFAAEALPWVPVAVVGPVLLLGHVDPSLLAPPLPWGTFQPVTLRVDDYERVLDACAGPMGEHMDAGSRVARGWGPGVGRFPDPLVLPTGRENALGFLREYYLHSRSRIRQLDEALAQHRGDEGALPEGYAAAIRFLVEERALVHMPSCFLRSQDQEPLPEVLRRRISVVTRLGTHLWCAAPTLPQSEAEDRLYAELGEGWLVHWLLRAGNERTSGVSAVSTAAAPPGSAAPFKIVLPAGAGGRTEKSDVVEAEERLILLEEKDWCRFDPRHRDSGEPENLWKWAVYKAVIDGATDLHLEPGASCTRVRQRVDGLLEEVLQVSAAVGEAMVYSLMTQVGLGSDKYRPADGSFQVEVLAKVNSRRQSVRVRANAYPVRGVTQKLALRFLPRQGAVPELAVLLPPGPTRFMQRAISRPEGLVLVCGPTGSGKTTTLFSALSGLNRPDVNVTTLENPVEILLDGTNQAEVNERRDVTWASLNRALLRQDPDVGLIGEIRDEDTARTILRAALTGHLVFGSLHTKSCPTSIVRLIDLGAERNMLAESLLLVECQRLIRRLCPQCRRQSELPSAHRALFERHNLPVPPLVYARGEHAERCEACRGRGYRGRIAAAEVLPNVPEVRGLIESAATSQAYLAWMRAHHLPTVFENALELVATGATSVEEALTLQDAWEGDEWHQLY